MTSDIDEEGYLKEPYYWYEEARYSRTEGMQTENLEQVI
jgi:hypothetical protein